MRKLKALIFKILAALILVPMVAFADDTCWSGNVPLGNNKSLCSRSPTSFNDLPLLTMNSSGDLVLNIPLTGRSILLQNALSQFAAWTSSGGLTLSTGGLTLTAGNITQSAAGGYIKQTVYVPTVAATPVAATNYCPGGLCVVPTAAANAAILIGDATPVVGIPYFIKNSNATNLIRAKASGGATINRAVAGGYIGLAAGASMRCIYLTAADLTCDTYAADGTTAALPTPAGP